MGLNHLLHFDLQEKINLAKNDISSSGISAAI